MAHPTIVTSSWFVPLPPKYARIGISRGTPRGQKGYRRFTALQPGPWFNSCASAEEYTRRYSEEILGKLDPAKTVEELHLLADGRTPALLCYEDPRPGPSWCHRALVSMWLFDRLGLEAFEFGQEEQGCGPFHPKLNPAARRHV